MKSSTQKSGWTLVWDWPSRVCHWGFAFSGLGALVIGLRCDPASEIFKYHILLGVVAAWFLLIRIGLGFGGCRRARWRAFFHPPGRTLRYFADVFRWRALEPDGINPGTSLFAAAVYLVLSGLILTGFDADWVERWHGWLAYGLIGLIACHLSGLMLHALRHRAWSPLAMLHGKWPLRTNLEPDSAHRAGGVALFVLSGLVTWLLFRYFDPSTAVLGVPFLPEVNFPLIQKG